MTDIDDDDVEYEIEQFQIGEHVFNITTVAYMPLSKLIQVHRNIPCLFAKFTSILFLQQQNYCQIKERESK